MAHLRSIALITIYLSRLISADDYVDPVDCKLIEDTSPEYQLKRHLFCDYDPSIRPAVGGNKTEFKMVLRLVFADYNEPRDELEIHTRLHMFWTDPFLTWKPSDFNGIESIRIKTHEIWTPEIYSMNPKYEEMGAIPESMCALTSDGKIICRPARVFVAPCDSDYTNWPYDTHKCTIKIGAPTYTSNEVSSGKGKSGIFMRHYNNHPQWSITIGNVRHGRTRSRITNGETFENIGVSFLLDRSYTSLKSVMISPAIILTVVTLTTLWLRPGSMERLILSCINLLGHLFTLHNIHANLPDTGNTVPNIMIFYNNSLILSTTALILTCWLQRLLESKRQVPTWLAKPVSAVVTSKPGRLVFMSLMESRASNLLQDDDDTSSLVDSQSTKSTWDNVVTVIGWISLVSFLFIYVVMSAVLL